jgi:hypothetical protein
VTARSGARALAIGRMAFGGALFAAPKRMGASWLGGHSERPAVQALVRTIGARDFVLGMIALHTVDHPEVGPRWQRTCAVIDSIDLFAYGAAGSDLPVAGLIGTTLLAGGAAAAGFYYSHALKQS